MLLSLCLVLIAIALFRDALPTIMGRALAALAVLVCLLYVLVFFGLDQLTGAGIDESVAFHLGADLDGAGIGEFSDLIALLAILSLAAVGIAYLTFRLSKAPEAADSKLPKRRVAAAYAVMFVALVINPATADIGHMLQSGRAQGTEAGSTDAPDYIASVSRPLRLDAPKNLVILYLESVEQTYFDQVRFPDLMPNLSALAPQALKFDDITQTHATGWTIAGMVASQCGLPLKGSSGDGVDRFLPDAVCIGDLLSEAGYTLDYIGGAPSRFAGKGTFYTTHGFDRVEGYRTLRDRAADPDYAHYWGLYDDTVLPEVSQRLSERHAEDQPFALVSLTLDTHDRNGGTISQSCADMPYRGGSNASLDAVHCADKLAGDFINSFLASPAAEDTVLIVMSDHLARPNLAWDLLEAGPRRNLFWAFGAGITPDTIGEPGTTIDTAPTIMGLIGANVPAMAYGRDLMSQSSMLRQEPDDAEMLFTGDQAYLKSLWSLPSLSGGMTVDLAGQSVHLSDRRVDKLPVLMLIDDGLNVTRLVFEIRGERTLAQYLAGLGYDEKFVWIDSCDRISVVQPLTSQGGSRFCTLIGSLGNSLTQSLPLLEGEPITPEVIAALLEGLEPSRSYYDSQIARIRSAVAFADHSATAYVPSNGLTGRIDIRAAGRSTTDSWVYDHQTETRTELDRGFTLLGFNSGEAPVKLGHIDTCAYGGAVQADDAPPMQNLHEAMSPYRDLFGAFALVLHDTAVCFEVPANLDGFFEGSELTAWQELRFDIPYTAIFAGNGEVQEFVGPQYAALGLEISDFIQPPRQRQLDWLARVGHAGGIYEGQIYTNSLNALDTNRDLYEIIELDLSWTTDRELVCLHDWASRYIDGEGPALDLAAFNERNAERPELDLCTLETLAAWLRDNPGPRILLDAKGDAVGVAQQIANRYPDLMDRFIPQIFQPEEYGRVRALGYPDIVWTLYKYSGSDEDVLQYITHMDLLALAMYQDRADSGLPTAARDKTGVLTWVHTVNESDGIVAALDAGAAEVMTDRLPPQVGAHVSVTAAGFGAGESSVTHHELGVTLPLQRGINLVGLDVDAPPQALARYDGCEVLKTGVAPDPAPFVDAIAQAKQDFGAVMVVVHDSAFCADVPLAPVLGNSGLGDWDKISFRQPYIGLLAPDAAPVSFVGETSELIWRPLTLPETGPVQ